MINTVGTWRDMPRKKVAMQMATIRWSGTVMFADGWAELPVTIGRDPHRPAVVMLTSEDLDQLADLLVQARAAMAAG